MNYLSATGISLLSPRSCKTILAKVVSSLSPIPGVYANTLRLHALSIRKPTQRTEFKEMFLRGLNPKDQQFLHRQALCNAYFSFVCVYISATGLQFRGPDGDTEWTFLRNEGLLFFLPSCLCWGESLSAITRAHPSSPHRTPGGFLPSQKGRCCLS